MHVNSSTMQTKRPGQLGAPLPRSELEARCHQLACDMGGLLLQPAFYTLAAASSSNPSTAEVTPSTEDGPLVITRVAVPDTVGGGVEYTLQITTGTRKVTTGAVRGTDAFLAPADQLGAALCAPIIVERTETLSFEITGIGGDVVAGDGFLVSGFHIRGPQGERLPPGVPERFTEQLGAEGVLWLIGLATTTVDPAAPVGVSAQRDCLAERFVFDVDEGAAVDVSSLGLAIGNTSVFPASGGLDAAVLRALTRPIVVEGHRWPIMASSRIVLTPTPNNGAGDVNGSRALVIGRTVRT